MHPLLRPSRLAAYLLLFFATTHTLFGLLFPTSFSPAADAVRDAMKSTHFAFQGSDLTYHKLHMGSGLLFTLYLVFSAFIAWVIGSPSVLRNPVAKEALKPIAWGLLVTQIGTLALSLAYFFPSAMGVSFAIVVLLQWEVTANYYQSNGNPGNETKRL